MVTPPVESLAGVLRRPRLLVREMQIRVEIEAKATAAVVPPVLP